MIKIDKRKDGKAIKLYFDDGGSLCIFKGPTGDLYFDPIINLIFDYNYNSEFSLYINKNDEIFKYFDKLYKEIINHKYENINIITDQAIALYSENYKREEASCLNIYEENDNVKLAFNCSKKPYEYRSYFVMVKNKDSIYCPYNENFMELFKNLKEEQKVLKK